MYAIVAVVYDDNLQVVSRRIWAGRVFNSFDEADEMMHSILIDGRISLFVKELR